MYLPPGSSMRDPVSLPNSMSDPLERRVSTAACFPAVSNACDSQSFTAAAGHSLPNSTRTTRSSAGCGELLTMLNVCCCAFMCGLHITPSLAVTPPLAAGLLPRPQAHAAQVVGHPAAALLAWPAAWAARFLSRQPDGCYQRALSSACCASALGSTAGACYLRYLLFTIACSPLPFVFSTREGMLHLCTSPTLAAALFDV